MKLSRRILLAILLGFICAKEISVEGQSPQEGQTGSPIFAEAKQEADKFIRSSFANCDGEVFYSIIRSEFDKSAYEIQAVKKLKWTVDEDEPSSPADKENRKEEGIEWSGELKIKAEISKIIASSNSKSSDTEKRWQNIPNGDFKTFSIEKIKGQWLIDGKPSTSTDTPCAAACELIELIKRSPERLAQVVKGREAELFGLMAKLDNTRVMSNSPSVLCASFEGYVKKLSDLAVSLKKRVSSNDNRPSNDQFQKLAKDAVQKFIDSNYVKCGQHRFAIFGQRGAPEYGLHLKRYDDVTQNLISLGKWIGGIDIPQTSNETIGEIFTRSVEVQLKTKGKPEERCTQQGDLIVDKEYSDDRTRFSTGRYADKVIFTYTSSQRGVELSGVGSTTPSPPSCGVLMKAWEASTKKNCNANY